MEEEVRECFAQYFTSGRLVRAPDSFPDRAFQVLEFLFRRKA